MSAKNSLQPRASNAPFNDPSSRFGFLRMLRLRKRSRLREAVEAAPRESLNEWKIHSVREAISEDWSKLADKNLTPTQRKALREHLDMNIAELRGLVGSDRDAQLRDIVIGRPDHLL